MPEQAPFSIDRRAVRQHYARQAGRSDAVDHVPRELASRMDERFDYMRITASRVLDLGCGTGADRQRLEKRFPGALVVGADFAIPALSRQRPGAPAVLSRLLGRPRGAALACADAFALPFASGSFDVVWSNLLLNWCDDPLPALREVHRVLSVGGMVMFSTLGPDTLKELRDILPSTSVHRFIDMHDVGDALVRAGFGDPVMDMQMLTVSYRDTATLFKDLREGGHSSADALRPRGLAGRSRWREALARLEGMKVDGALHLSLEAVFGHAWKLPPRTDDQGRAIIRFDKAPVR